TDLADVVKRGATFEHLDEVAIDLAGQAGNARRFLGQNSAVALQAHDMENRFNIAFAHEVGEGEHKSIANLHEVAVTRKQILFELAIARQHVAIEEIAAVLCILQAQRGVHASQQLNGTELAREIVIGASGENLGHVIVGDLRRKNDDLEIG